MLKFDGTKLKQLRKDKKLNQGELGAKVGKQTSHISNYENGVASPPAETLLTLMDFFEISPKEISVSTN